MPRVVERVCAKQRNLNISARNLHTVTFRERDDREEGRPETPEDINWTNVSSYFDLEIASSIKVRKW